jgi:hypothetical protein
MSRSASISHEDLPSGKAKKAAAARRIDPEVKDRLTNLRSAYDWSRISNELDDMALSMPAFRVYCNPFAPVG